MTAGQYDDILARGKITGAQVAVATESHQYADLAEKLQEFGSLLIETSKMLKATSDELSNFALESITIQNIRSANAIAETSTLLRTNLLDVLDIDIRDFTKITLDIQNVTKPIMPDTNNIRNRSDFMELAHTAMFTGKADRIIELAEDNQKQELNLVDSDDELC
jgi:hypothetical protein